MDEDQKLAMDDGQACGVTPASLLDSCEATASSTVARSATPPTPGESEADRGANGAHDQSVGEPRREPMDRSPARAMGGHQKRG
jgi:hypothetical protein